MGDDGGDDTADGEFEAFDTQWFRPDPAGGFEARVPRGIRSMFAEMMGSLDEILSSDSDHIRRVFPTAYPDDPEREAGYQALVRGELIERHRASAATVVATLDADHLTEEQLTAWMTATNALRLVFGTALDLSEDDDFEIDPSDPDAGARVAYQVLTQLLGDIVAALSESA